MTYSELIVEKTNHVATITLNRPKSLNAFNNQMTAELIDALHTARHDDAVRCIVLTGSGRAFSAGQDLHDMKAHEGSVGDHLREGFNKIALMMVEMPKPIIGKINGVAAGAGCSIALATDFRIASPKASFMQAFTKIGLVPDTGANWILPRLVGYPRAFELMATAENVSAEKALAYGMVNYVVPETSLDEITAAWATKFATGATVAIGLAKQAMIESYTSSFATTLNSEAVMQDIADSTDDSKEGVDAFFDKRAANFKGK